MIKFAKDVYDESYPDDAGLYDDDFTNRKNPLNRFVSYHILPFYCGYRNFNLVFDFMSLYMVGTTDPEDYFEPYADNSLMRVSTNFNIADNSSEADAKIESLLYQAFVDGGMV